MKKILITIGCLLLAFTFSCGKKKKGSTNTVSIFTYSGNEYEGIAYDSTMKALEEKVGLKIEICGASPADYYTKLSPLISSLRLPDVFWCDPKNSNGAYQNWVDPSQGLVQDLDSILLANQSRYPYLNKLIYSDQYKNITYFGKHFLIPAVETNTAWAIYYRADWLEAIGFVDAAGNAKAPTTLDEFEEVMSKFSGNNLFDNGKSGRTYGISPNTNNYYVNPLYGAFGIKPDWDIDAAGNVTYMYTNETFKDYLKWMNAMYQKGYIDPTFNQNNDFNDREKWYKGEIGCIMTNGEAHMEWVVGNFENAQGKGKVIVGPPLLGTGNTSELTGCKLGVAGERGYSNWGGYYGGYTISSTCADPYKVLDLFEYMISPEGSTLRLYGIEGTHYTKDASGNIVANVENREDELHQLFSLVKDEDGNNVAGGLHKIGKLFGYAVDWNKYEATGQIAVGTDIGSLYPAYGSLVRQAMAYTEYQQTPGLLNVTAYPSSLDSKINEVKKISNALINKVIVGTTKLDDGWNQMMSDCNKAGYAQICAVLKETAQELGIIE